MAYSCKKRCCCPSFHQKRVLIFAEHLAEEVLENVPHRQFVFTIPKRFRLYFQYDRSLLGKLRRVAWETVKDVYQAVLGDKDVVPGMVGTIQSFGSLINFNPHCHAIISDGAFRRDGTFPHWKSIPTLPEINRNFEVFKSLDFLAQMTQHIPDKYQNLTAYFGHYSCRSRGERKKIESLDSLNDSANTRTPGEGGG